MANGKRGYAVSFLIFDMSADQNKSQFNLVDRLLIDVSKANNIEDFMTLVMDGIRASLNKPGMKAEIDMLAVGNKLVFLSSDLNQADFRVPSVLDDVLKSLAVDLATDGHFEVVGNEILRTDIPALKESYENPPTVAVLLVETKSGLVVIRRGLNDGLGKLALLGGFQVKGETWQEAAAREVLEETGLALDPSKINIRDLITVGDGSINLAFGQYTEIVGDFEPNFDSEILSVEWVKSPVDTAFPTHTAMINAYFEDKISR